MNNKIEEPPLTEPLVVPCLFVTGAAIEAIDGVMRLIGWTSMPVIAGGEMTERRIVIRFAMPGSVAWKLRDDLGRALRRDEK